MLILSVTDRANHSFMIDPKQELRLACFYFHHKSPEHSLQQYKPPDNRSFGLFSGTKLLHSEFAAMAAASQRFPQEPLPPGTYLYLRGDGKRPATISARAAAITYEMNKENRKIPDMSELACQRVCLGFCSLGMSICDCRR